MRVWGDLSLSWSMSTMAQVFLISEGCPRRHEQRHGQGDKAP